MVLVLVTTPDLKVARKIARVVLNKRLAACANIVPKIESHYWWQGKLESSAEALIVFKTTRARLAALEKTVLANHPYDTPEVIALPLASGNPKYLSWLAASVASDARR
jgi:periplasmic divalent cation tolerance protein